MNLRLSLECIGRPSQEATQSIEFSPSTVRPVDATGQYEGKPAARPLALRPVDCETSRPIRLQRRLTPPPQLTALGRPYRSRAVGEGGTRASAGRSEIVIIGAINARRGSSRAFDPGTPRRGDRRRWRGSINFLTKIPALPANARLQSCSRPDISTCGCSARRRA